MKRKKTDIKIGKTGFTVDEFQEEIFSFHTITPELLIRPPTLYERFFDMNGYKKYVNRVANRLILQGQNLAKLSVIDYIDVKLSEEN